MVLWPVLLKALSESERKGLVQNTQNKFPVEISRTKDKETLSTWYL